MKRIVLALAVMLTLALMSNAAQAADIAYVDLQKALNFSDAGVKAKQDLKTEAKKLEDDLNAKQAELKKLKDEIDQKRGVWNPDFTEAKTEELKERSLELQKEFMQSGEELNKKKAKRENDIIKQLTKVVEEIAREKGYSYVLESSLGVILHAPQDADITEAVIARHNKRHK